MLAKPHAASSRRELQPHWTALGLAGFALLQSTAVTAAIALPTLTGCLALAAIGGQLDLRRRSDATEISLGVLLAIWVTSALAGSDPQHSLQLSVPTLCFAMAVVAMRRSAWQERDAASVLWSLQIAAAIQAGQILWQSKVGLAGAQAVTAAGVPWLVVPNDLAWMACAMPALWALLQRTPLPAGRVVLLGLLVIQCSAFALAHSRLALLCMACAASGLLFAGSRARVRTVLVCVVFAGIVAALALDPWGKGLASLHSRAQLWAAARTIGTEHPALGIGPHNFGAQLDDRLGAEQRNDPRGMPWPHQLPLEILACLGWFGVLACGALGCLAANNKRPLGPIGFGILLAALAAAMLEASMLRTWVWWGAALMIGWPTKLGTPQNAGPQGSTR